MKRCVIVGGAKIENYGRVKSHLKPSDFMIYCDGGLKHMEALEAAPDLIVGDFDSFDNPNLPVETISLPCEKDDTDTIFAIKEAMKRGFDEYLLIGVVGERLDHTLGNVYALLMLDSNGRHGAIVDDYSVMEIVSDGTAYVNDRCSYFSLINISGTARGIMVKNAKYPLENAEITPEYQYGISNETLPGKTAEITVKEGRMLLIKVY